MIKPFLVALALALAAMSAAPVQAQQYASQTPAAAPNRAPHAMGPLHIGMARTEVHAMRLETHSRTVHLDGGDWTKDNITFADGVRIDALYANGIISDLSTTSRAYATAEGAHVGDSVATLRALYLNGELHWGNDPSAGPYLNFETGVRGQFFSFNSDNVRPECINRHSHCPESWDDKRSMMLYVR